MGCTSSKPHYDSNTSFQKEENEMRQSNSIINQKEMEELKKIQMLKEEQEAIDKLVSDRENQNSFLKSSSLRQKSPQKYSQVLESPIEYHSPKAREDKVKHRNSSRAVPMIHENSPIKLQEAIASTTPKQISFSNWPQQNEQIKSPSFQNDQILTQSHYQPKKQNLEKSVQTSKSLSSNSSLEKSIIKEGGFQEKQVQALAQINPYSDESPNKDDNKASQYAKWKNQSPIQQTKSTQQNELPQPALSQKQSTINPIQNKKSILKESPISTVQNPLKTIVQSDSNSNHSSNQNDLKASQYAKWRDQTPVKQFEPIKLQSLSRPSLYQNQSTFSPVLNPQPLQKESPLMQKPKKPLAQSDSNSDEQSNEGDLKASQYAKWKDYSPNQQFQPQENLNKNNGHSQQSKYSPTHAQKSPLLVDYDVSKYAKWQNDSQHFPLNQASQNELKPLLNESLWQESLLVQQKSLIPVQGFDPKQSNNFQSSQIFNRDKQSQVLCDYDVSQYARWKDPLDQSMVQESKIRNPQSNQQSEKPQEKSPLLESIMKISSPKKQVENLNQSSPHQQKNKVIVPQKQYVSEYTQTQNQISKTKTINTNTHPIHKGDVSQTSSEVSPVKQKESTPKQQVQNLNQSSPHQQNKRPQKEYESQYTQTQNQISKTKPINSSSRPIHKGDVSQNSEEVSPVKQHTQNQEKDSDWSQPNGKKYKKVFHSNLQQSIIRDNPFILEEVVKNKKLNKQQADDLSIAQKIISKKGDKIDKYVTDICFGCVINVISNQIPNGKSRSLKILFPRNDDSVQNKQFMEREIGLMEETKNKKGVVSLQSYSIEEQNNISAIIFELQDQVIGTLLEYKNHYNNNINERTFIKKSVQLIEGLDSVFDNKSNNYSLIAKNILICNSTEDIKLVDFGKADIQDNNKATKYVRNKLQENQVLQSPQIRYNLKNSSSSIIQYNPSHQIYSAGASLALLADINEKKILTYSDPSQNNSTSSNDVFTNSSSQKRVEAARNALIYSLQIDSLAQIQSLSKQNVIIQQNMLAQSMKVPVFPVSDSKGVDSNLILSYMMDLDDLERKINDLTNFAAVLSSKYFIGIPITRLSHENIKGPMQSKAPESKKFNSLKNMKEGLTPEDHFFLALGYSQHDINHKLALQNILKALDLTNGRNGEYINCLGCILINLQKYEQALIAFQLAKEISPNYAQSYYNAGLIKHRVEREPEEALKQYQNGLSLDNQLYEAIFNIALLQKNYLGEIKLGRENYQRYNKLFLKDSQVDNNIGVLYPLNDFSQPKLTILGRNGIQKYRWNIQNNQNQKTILILGKQIINFYLMKKIFSFILLTFFIYPSKSLLLFSIYFQNTQLNKQKLSEQQFTKLLSFQTSISIHFRFSKSNYN